MKKSIDALPSVDIVASMKMQFDKFSATLGADGIVVTHRNGASVAIPARVFEAWVMRQFRADFSLSGRAQHRDKDGKK